MNVNKILPFLLLLPFLASCTSKYKIEGTSSVNSLDGKMLYLKSLREGFVADPGLGGCGVFFCVGVWGWLFRAGWESGEVVVWFRRNG